MRSVIHGAMGSAILLSVYFISVSLVSGWDFAKSQFASFWYFISSLSIGFGIQVGLYSHLKNFVKSGQGTRKVLGVTGTTSTVAMISCCTHYLVNILPFLGIAGVLSVIGQYQTQLFWIGLFFNLLGIIYLTNKIISAKKLHEAH